MPGDLIDYTPFGYLRNPAHRATAWSETSGGNLRTAPDFVGIEWVYPVGRDPATRLGLCVETVIDGQACRTRSDFDEIGLGSAYHSCLIMGFDWQFDSLSVEARFFLTDDDALCARLLVRNTSAEQRRTTISVGGRLDSADLVTDDVAVLATAPVAHVIVGGQHADLELAPGEERRLVTVMARDATEADALRRGRAALTAADEAYARLLEQDAAFYAACPTLSGDWPAHWPEGLHHDFETTRLIVQPGGGIFQDVWPSWMSAWPRVVLAEGTLDMLRLAYADPSLAKRAVLSLFRDAPQANIPCVFRGGEYNMVAADGSRCGTSPAWCLPFRNLELLYLRTLDREWLSEVYPRTAAYLDWWLVNRVDADGWLVYKCTWESGEDGNPRLDPTGSGDADISGHVRPVELQATMAHAAGVMAFFATELNLPSERWQTLANEYREHTRQLYDPSLGRYRDWLIDEQRFQDLCPEKSYWGIDPCRCSAQSLTPLLIGEPLDEAEVWRHACQPWTSWPSWTWSLVESAASAGLHQGVGEVAFEIVDRVYRTTTRREVGSLARPMPGTSPEYWPEDWRTYGGSDAYGWGATTANLLLRHLFGFKESRETDGWVAELTPALPRALRIPGARYAIRGLNYRGRVFDLSYMVVAHQLVADLDLGSAPSQCSVMRGAESVYASSRSSPRHEFPLEHGHSHVVRLG